MELNPGDKLGPYEIVSAIGKGGMGEVWKARDPRLHRDVAIKISARQFTDRFEREARAIAALNHPNICTLFDIGPNYLVMEFIEGPTLVERIAQGPIPLDDALRIARQIAYALEAAHDKSIVHRDLKPANVKIQPNGSIKVLDFGLAKSGGDAEITADSPTLLPSTQAGMILGTPEYMSPEQARGQPVDKRTDIWAFGVVLYEMLTGERLFSGKTGSDTLAAVIRDEPDFDRVPPSVRRLLRLCLKKDAHRRLRDITGVELLLEEAAHGPVPSRGFSGASSVVIVPWAIVALLVAVATGLGSVAWRLYTAQPHVLRMTLQTPEKAEIGLVSAIPVISPDGSRVTFAASTGGPTELWLRDLDGLSARQLPATEGASYPFWSPDSRWIGFFADGRLKKIEVTGGPVQTLCDAPTARGGTWNKEDVIVFGLNPAGLFRVPAAGGTPALLAEPDAAVQESNLRAPSFLPDGRHFLYTARSNDSQKTRIFVDSIDTKPGTKTRREILVANSNAVYVPSVPGSLANRNQGYLLFANGATLMAQPFDSAAFRTLGEAVPVADQVDYFPSGAQSQFSASRDGLLAYTSGAVDADVLLTWFDRTGKAQGTVGTAGEIKWASLSPDGSTVAADRVDASGQTDIWLYNLARGTASRFTFGPFFESPVWSPDGNNLVFYSQRIGPAQPWEKASSGVGQQEALDSNKDGRTRRVEDWSRDGRYLIEDVTDSRTRTDIWVIPTFGDKKSFAYVDSEFDEGSGKVSPNGHFLAYRSDEFNRSEVYVQTFPEHGGKWQVSTAGGAFPVWSRDGSQLFFISADNKMMAVDVTGDARKFEATIPRALFPVPAQAQFDVDKSGRFLIHVPQAQAVSRPITVVVNWQSALKK